MSAEITLVKVKMFLLDVEEKGSEIYHPLLAELWRIIREQEKEDHDAEARPGPNGKGA